MALKFLPSGQSGTPQELERMKREARAAAAGRARGPGRGSGVVDRGGRLQFGQDAAKRAYPKRTEYVAAARARSMCGA